MVTQADVFADTSGAYWLAGLLTLVVMVVMRSESREDRTP
jgi:hypothetical protein